MNEASLKTNGQQVVTRIGFAERWLDRARRQCQDGDVDRGLLTLVLATAEMTHAIRLAHPTAKRRARWIVPALAATTVASLAFVLLAGQRQVPAPASSAEAPVIVTLNDRVGTLLELVRAEPGPVVTQAVAQPAIRQPSAGGSRRVRTSLPLTVQGVGSVTVTHSRPAPTVTVAKPVSTPPIVAAPSVPPAQTVAESGLSDGDLIALVLAADRRLRTQSLP